MEHNVAMEDDESLSAYKACLAEALHCLLTDELLLGEGEDNSGEFLASTLRLHLRKQLAFREYTQQFTSALAVDTTSQTVDDDSIRRKLLMQCFQGANLYYSPIQSSPSPSPSPHSQIGPSL